MFHKAIDLEFLNGTELAVRFQDGTVKKYDMSVLFRKYPQLKALEDRTLFLPYGPKKERHHRASRHSAYSRPSGAA